MKCSHCGGFRHTKDGFFKIIGYLEWWDDLQWKKASTKALMNRAGGKALFTALDPTGGGHTEGLEETTMEDGEDGTKNQKKKADRILRGEGEMEPGKGKGNGKRFKRGFQENHHMPTPNPTPTQNHHMPTPNPTPTLNNLKTQNQFAVVFWP